MLWTILEAICFFGAVLTGFMAAKDAHSHFGSYVICTLVGTTIGALFTFAGHIVGGRIGDYFVRLKRSELYLALLYICMLMWAFLSMFASGIVGRAIVTR